MKVSHTPFVLFIIICAIIIFIPRAEAQISPVNKPSAGLSYSFMGSNDELPFWFHANSDGVVRTGAQYQNIARFWAHDRLTIRQGDITINTGAETILRHGNTRNTLHFLQLYASAEYGSFRLSAGRFYDTRGIYMEPLTMGSMTQSRNATPVPKIKLETIGYTDVPRTDGRAQFHFTWSDGRLENNRTVESPYLHQKSIYLKINIWRLDLIGGFDHNVVWGGSGEILDGRLASRSDYFRVVLGRTEDGEGRSTGARLGNSVASYDFGVNYRDRDDRYMLRAYRTFFIETTAASRFRSPWDGVWGLGLIMKEQGNYIDAILYEHIYTLRQDSANEVPAGRATYYNHATYRTGWSYFGNVLGNPLITFDRSIAIGEQPVTNNQILAHHLGIKGTIASGLTYTLFANYSRNYGICNDRLTSDETTDLRCTRFRATEPLPDHVTELPRGDFREDRYSFFLRLDYELRRFNGISIHGAAAFDRGAYSGRLNGLMAGISWQATGRKAKGSRYRGVLKRRNIATW